MPIDLICCNESFQNLGYNKAIKANIIKARDQKELRKKISKEKGLVIVEGCYDNRFILENKRVDILVSPERNRGKDHLHYRHSGLDDVLCKIAKKNNIAIAFSFSEILNNKNRSKQLGRIMQNIRFCRKYKLRIVFASFAKTKWEMRNPEDLMSLAIVLGMHQKEAKGSIEATAKILKEKEESRSFIAEGVKIIP